MDYPKAQTYWDIKDKENVIMDREELLKWTDRFLSSHNTLSLATACEGYIDNTPLEYNYVDGKIYILTEGGHKFISLEKNKNVAVCIYDSYQGFGKIQSVQIFGKCELLEGKDDTYYKVTDFKKIPRTYAEKMGLYLLRIDISKIQILSSDFKKNGYSNRQVIEF